MLFHALDVDHTGKLDFLGFLHMVSTFKAERAARSRSVRGLIQQAWERRKHSHRLRKVTASMRKEEGVPKSRFLRRPFLVRCGSTVRISWDVAMMVPVVFLLIVVPLRLGFEIEDDSVWYAIDRTIDAFFVMDIVVNLRTSFINHKGLYNYGLYSNGLLSYGLCRHGSYSYGLYGYGLYSHALYSYGLCVYGAFHSSITKVWKWSLGGAAP